MQQELIAEIKIKGYLYRKYKECCCKITCNMLQKFIYIMSQVNEYLNKIDYLNIKNGACWLNGLWHK